MFNLDSPLEEEPTKVLSYVANPAGSIGAAQVKPPAEEVHAVEILNATLDKPFGLEFKPGFLFSALEISVIAFCSK